MIITQTGCALKWDDFETIGISQKAGSVLKLPSGVVVLQSDIRVDVTRFPLIGRLFRHIALSLELAHPPLLSIS